MPPVAKKKDPKEFVIAYYQRPNESFPTRFDVMVNGHVGILIENRNCILPRFLIDQAIMAKSFTHKEPDPNAENDSYNTIAVRPNITIFTIDEEYQSPEGIMRFIKECQDVNDMDSPHYRVRLGVKNLIFGDMLKMEDRASKEVKSSPKAISDEGLQNRSRSQSRKV
jgi:hypothetical protein